MAPRPGVGGVIYFSGRLSSFFNRACSAARFRLAITCCPISRPRSFTPGAFRGLVDGGGNIGAARLEDGMKFFPILTVVLFTGKRNIAHCGRGARVIDDVNSTFGLVSNFLCRTATVSAAP
jgi:hypothetical protein